MITLLDPRLQRQWDVFRQAWHDPADASKAWDSLSTDGLDALAWTLFHQGALEAIDLRRARWLGETRSSRLLQILLLARLSRGQGSARQGDLLQDLERWTRTPIPATWNGTGLASVPLLLEAQRSSLCDRLREAVLACTDDPHDLVRCTHRRNEPVLAFARYRLCEDDLSNRLKHLLSEPPSPDGRDIPPEILTGALALHARQEEAVRNSLRHRFTVVAGGPGTGKTTVVARILQALEATDSTWSRDGVVLCAPTGRAKARLQESLSSQFPSGEPFASSTVHALLGARPNGSFRHDSSRPLPWSTIVLDEASMVDHLLFAGLLAALHPRSRLVVLGDPDQLPSVEAGGLFADLVGHLETLPESRRPFVRLTHTWRNAGAIRELAQEVNLGGSDLAMGLAASGTVPDDAFADAKRSQQTGLVGWLTGSLEDVLEHWWALHAFGEDTRDASMSLGDRMRSSRILCATHQGMAGRERINALGDSWLREKSSRSNGASGREAWPEGRPVLLLRNLPNLDLWNGDLGVTGLREGEPVVRFPRGDHEELHHPSRLESLDAAWAITIHKSQGSEFDHVLLILPEEDSPLLTRQILYTGLTRARKTLWIWGNPDLWSAAAARKDDRSSALLELGDSGNQDSP